MIEPAPGNLLDLVILSPGLIAAVTIRKAEQLHMPVAVFETKYSELIRRMRLMPQGGIVSREIWYYNRYGTWRFFRIEDTGIRELSREGAVVPAVGSLTGSARRETA